MTGHQRTARAAFAVTAAMAGATAWAGAQHLWLLAGVFAYIALFTAWTSRTYHGLHRTEQARHERALGASGAAHTPASAVPCCSFWRNSDGEVHGPDCTRPVLPRRDRYRLDDADRATFEEITAHFDDRSTA